MQLAQSSSRSHTPRQMKDECYESVCKTYNLNLILQSNGKQRQTRLKDKAVEIKQIRKRTGKRKGKFSFCLSCLSCLSCHLPALLSLLERRSDLKMETVGFSLWQCCILGKVDHFCPPLRTCTCEHNCTLGNQQLTDTEIAWPVSLPALVMSNVKFV